MERKKAEEHFPFSTSTSKEMALSWQGMKEVGKMNEAYILNQTIMAMMPSFKLCSAFTVKSLSKFLLTYLSQFELMKVILNLQLVGFYFTTSKVYFTLIARPRLTPIPSMKMIFCC